MIDIPLDLVTGSMRFRYMVKSEFIVVKLSFLNRNLAENHVS